MEENLKQLLLTDLGARLTYGVKVTWEWDGKYPLTITPHIYCAIVSENKIENLPKLLLRPMSSMTEEEFTELKNYTELKYDELELVEWDDTHKTIEFYLEEIPHYCVIKVFDWLNARHFDYRGLIEKGLALEAQEGVYKEWISIRGNLKEDKEGNIVGGLKL